MRLFNTYRGVRRNVIRAAGNIRRWGELLLWQGANIAAKIEERTKIANKARHIHDVAYRSQKNSIVRAKGRARAALIEFYTGLKRSRVYSRILKALTNPPSVPAPSFAYGA